MKEGILDVNQSTGCIGSYKSTQSFLIIRYEGIILRFELINDYCFVSKSYFKDVGRGNE